MDPCIEAGVGDKVGSHDSGEEDQEAGDRPVCGQERLVGGVPPLAGLTTPPAWRGRWFESGPGSQFFFGSCRATKSKGEARRRFRARRVPGLSKRLGSRPGKLPPNGVKDSNT